MTQTPRMRRPLRGLAMLSILALAGTAVAAPPSPFEAGFEFHRNGKLIGESRFRFDVEDGNWVMSTETEGTKGLARLLGLEESSESRGDWSDGGPRPLGFQQTVKVAVKNIETRADFDWEAGTVHSVHEDGETDLDLVPGVLDPVSAGLAIRAGLARNETEWRLTLVDEDELEEQLFRLAGSESLDTKLGCLETRRVDRIRGPESTRYTQTWYAVAHDWVPVKVAHGKTDGDRMESHLVSLELDGVPVERGAPCP